MHAFRLTIAMSLAALVLAAPLAGAAAEPQVRQSGDISFMSGGVSEEARDILQRVGRDFNLKLVMATKSGAYLSDVDIEVDDAQGRRVLSARSDGPWFYAKLPGGRYQVAASANGTTVRRAVTVGAQGQNTVDLRWDN